MRRLSIIMICGLALLLTACSGGNMEEINQPHGQIAMQYIEFINDNLYNRIPFSYREHETALWIVDELVAMGYVRRDIEIQEFYRGDVQRLIFNEHLLRGAELRDYSQNIILTVPGQSERAIIVGAHYDGVHNPGASDNASGTALLLESAQRMLRHDNYYTIIYVFFGAEELALVGSSVFRDSIIERRDDVVMMINADVLIEGPYALFGAGNSNRNSETANNIIQRVDAIAQEVNNVHGIEIINYPGAVHMMSDHTVFFASGYTIVNLVGLARTEQGRFHARVWHTPQDCIHHINETWPGKVEANMHAFSIFLEEMLLAGYDQLEAEFEMAYEPTELEPEVELHPIPHGQISVRHIEFMNDNLYGRTPFTYREKEAAMWIVEELLVMGYAEEDIYMQEFNWPSVLGQAQRWFGREWADIYAMSGNSLLRDGQLSQNVILAVPGQSESESFIIVGAHYDTVPVPGASDNASGTALLLESAQRMLHKDNYHTIIYVFFGAEEPGLFGAYYFLNSLSKAERDNVIMMINADVLFEGPYMIFGAGYVPVQYWWDGLPEGARGWTPVSQWWVDNLEPRGNDVTAKIDEIAAELKLVHDVNLIREPRFMLNASDHWIFAWEGYTVVNLLGLYRVADRGFFVDSGFTARVVHTPQDDFHYINERWPGKIDTNMRYFSIFLEEMLLAKYE